MNKKTQQNSEFNSAVRKYKFLSSSILSIVYYIILSLFLCLFIINFVVSYFPDKFHLDFLPIELDAALYVAFVVLGLFGIFKLFKPNRYQSAAPFLMRLKTPLFGRSPVTTLQENCEKDGVLFTASGAIKKLISTKNIVVDINIFNDISITNTMLISDDCLEICDLKNGLIYIDEQSIESNEQQKVNDFKDTIINIISALKKANYATKCYPHQTIASAISMTNLELSTNYSSIYKATKPQDKFQYSLVQLTESSINSLDLSQRLKDRLRAARKEISQESALLLLVSHKEEEKCLFDAVISLSLEVDKNLKKIFNEETAIFISPFDKEFSLSLAEKLHIFNQPPKNEQIVSHAEYSTLEPKKQEAKVKKPAVFYEFENSNEILKYCSRSLCIGTGSESIKNLSSAALLKSPEWLKKNASFLTIHPTSLFVVKQKCKKYAFISFIAAIVYLIAYILPGILYFYKQDLVSPFLSYIICILISFFISREGYCDITSLILLIVLPISHYVLSDVIISPLATLFAVFLINDPFLLFGTGLVLLGSKFYPIHIDYKIIEQISEITIHAAIFVFISMFLQSRLVRHFIN